MPGDPDALLGAGREALEAGDWPLARRSFEAVLAEGETPEALVGLGTALWWLEEIDESLRCRERAYAVFRRRPDPEQAAMVALGMIVDHGASLGNEAAARGWLERFARLVDEFGLEPLTGWVEFARAAQANMTGDTHAGEGFARAALEHARRHSDLDLELCALAQIGGAMILSGRVEAGMALLDEAMAAALSGEGRPDTVVQTSCVTIACYSRAAELRRAAQWIRAAEDFNRRFGSSHLYALCRTHLGIVLLGLGRFEEAETHLEAAVRTGRAAEPVLHAEAVAALAELRLAQGRTTDAAALVAGLEDRAVVAPVRAALHLVAGQPGAAAAILRRRIPDLAGVPLDAAPLLELLGEAEIALGDTEAALATARDLAALAPGEGSTVIAARADRALGRALAASGDPRAAMTRLERALERFAALEMPLEAARTRMLLARATAPAEREAAIADARAALASFEALGAARDADAAAALLRSLGVRAARSGPHGGGVLTRREREVLALLGEGLSNREIAERLFVTRKTVENHVASVLFKLDLSSRSQAAAYAVRHVESAKN